MWVWRSWTSQWTRMWRLKYHFWLNLREQSLLLLPLSSYKYFFYIIIDLTYGHVIIKVSSIRKISLAFGKLILTLTWHYGKTKWKNKLRNHLFLAVTNSKFPIVRNSLLLVIAVLFCVVWWTQIEEEFELRKPILYLVLSSCRKM